MEEAKIDEDVTLLPRHPSLKVLPKKRRKKRGYGYGYGYGWVQDDSAMDEERPQSVCH